MSAIPRILHHGGHIDPEGMLVYPAAGQFEEFQAALRRYHPALYLAYDRGAERVMDSAGLWCIARTDHEVVRLKVSLDETLTFNRPYQFIVQQLAWAVQTENGIQRYYREPGDWVFSRLKKYKRAALDGRDAGWITDALREHGENQRNTWRAETKQAVSDIVDEWVPFVDLLEPSKFKPSIVVPEGAPSSGRP